MDAIRNCLLISFGATLLLCNTTIAAQSKAPRLQWQKSVGGSKMDWATSICPTIDGGYIMTGFTESNDGDIKGSIGYGDYLVVKLDQNGAVQWQKCLGGQSREFPNSIQVTKDGGYIVAGYSYSNDRDVSGNHGSSDAWMAKLDRMGAIEWQKCFGGSMNDCTYAIIQASDGGFVAAGFTDSKDGDLSDNYGRSDCWIIKLSSQGDIQWQKRLGGSSDDVAQSVCESAEGGYFISGYTWSDDLDIRDFKGEVDAWLIKLHPDGSVAWQKCFGGSGVEYAQSVEPTSDGGSVFTGMTTSKDGDVTNSYGAGDLWIAKVDKEGNLQWNKVFGGSSDDIGMDIVPAADTGYTVAGQSFSRDGDVRDNNEETSAWIIQVSNTGQLVWQKSLGVGGRSMLYSVKATRDYGWIAAGFTGNKEGDSPGTANDENCYVVKLLAEETGSPYIPNAFTPNADGLNDVWNLSFLSAFPQCRVEIFNRWGQLIFSSKGYTQPWDGTYKGVRVPAGVYGYVIDRGPGLRKISGTLVVIR